MPNLESQQSCADYPRAFFLFWFPFHYKKAHAVLLDTRLFWCQEMCDGMVSLASHGERPVLETILLFCTLLVLRGHALND